MLQRCQHSQHTYAADIHMIHWCHAQLPVAQQWFVVARAGSLQKLDMTSFGLKCSFASASLAMFSSLETLILSENPGLTVRPCKDFAFCTLDGIFMQTVKLAKHRHCMICVRHSCLFATGRATGSCTVPVAYPINQKAGMHLRWLAGCEMHRDCSTCLLRNWWVWALQANKQSCVTSSVACMCQGLMTHLAKLHLIVATEQDKV